MKVKDMGIVTINSRSYWIQHVTLRPTQPPCIYVFEAEHLERRGRFFTGITEFFDWVESAPRQLPLPFHNAERPY